MEIISKKAENCLFYFVFFIVCLQYFIMKFQKAKREENDEFLLKVQKVHRKARKVLDGDGVKDKIRRIIEERRTSAQRKSLFKGFTWMFRYMERYGNSPGSAIFQRTITDVMNNPPLQRLLALPAPSDAPNPGQK